MKGDKTALKAKLASMYGKLYDHDDYAALAQCGTVAEIGAKLCEGVYGGVLGTLNHADFHRELIERKLQLSLADDFVRIHSFECDFKAKQYLDAYFLKNRIDMIKLILTSIYDEWDIGFLYTLPEIETILGKTRRFDAQKLVASKTVTEFVENLRHTEFKDILSKKFAEDVPSFFEIEVELDIYYYLNLKEVQAECLRGKTRKVADKLLGVEIDLRNITWLYRLKKFYNMSGTAVFAYIMPHSFNLSKKELTKMADAKDTAELDAAIADCCYGKDFKGVDKIERGFYSGVAKSLSNVRKEGTGLNAAAAYLRLKEFEIKNITSVVESKKYGLKADDSMNLLIGNF